MRKRKKELTLKRLVALRKQIPDERRQSGNCRHRLSDVVVICLLGTLICGRHGSNNVAINL